MTIDTGTSELVSPKTVAHSYEALPVGKRRNRKVACRQKSFVPAAPAGQPQL